MKIRWTILFVCHFNSIRSQLAEGLARSMAPPDVRILSGGIESLGVNPDVRRALDEIGIDSSKQYSKVVHVYLQETIDEIIVLDESLRSQVAPLFPASILQIWPTLDPATGEREKDKRATLLRRIRDELAARIQALFFSGR